MRHVAPGWDEALNGGKESVACDLKAEPELARALLERADIVLEGFRPGVAARLGVGPDDAPAVGRLLLDHRLRRRRAARGARRPRPQLPRLGGHARGHGARAAAAAAGRPRRRSARRRRRGARGGARARAHGPWRAADDLDDARLPPARLAPARRRPAAALPHRRARLLPDLRDRRRPLAHGRRARAEVLRPALRGDRPPGARGAPPRPRGAGGARRRARGDVRRRARSTTGCSSSTARTSASARSRRSAEAAEAFGGGTGAAVRSCRAAYERMAGRARLLLIAAALAPLPLLAGLAWDGDAAAARALPKLVVSSRDGDLYVGERAITTAGTDTEPDWSPDRRRIAFVRQDRGKRSTSLYVVRRDGGGLQRLTRGDQVVAHAGLARRRAPARLRREPARRRQLRHLDGRPGGRQAAARRHRRRRADRALVHARRQGRVPAPSSPASPSRRRRATPARRSSGRASCSPTSTSGRRSGSAIAGTKLGFASATDNVGDGPVWIRGSRPVAGRHDARASSSSG